uniref:Uncharacterized protein n=1 Tax=Heterorhabditis bacteriophora TaxID=37862 RepID=A0A1I7WF71_HETBA
MLEHINIICIYNMKYNTFLQLSKFYRSHDQIFSVVQNYYLNTELIVELLLVHSNDNNNNNCHYYLFINFLTHQNFNIWKI